jgi:hypothetical protein
VSIDSNGLLKVTHMVPFSSAATTASQAPGSFTGMLPTQVRGTAASCLLRLFVSARTEHNLALAVARCVEHLSSPSLQAALNSAQACVVQFVSLPTDEEV